MATASLRSAKQLLRKEMKQVLNALTEGAKARQSAAVTKKLIADDTYQSANSLSIYLNMPDEIHTLDLLKDALRYITFKLSCSYIVVRNYGRPFGHQTFRPIYSRYNML